MDLHVHSIPEDWKIAAAKVVGELEVHEHPPGTAKPQPAFDLPDAEG